MSGEQQAYTSKNGPSDRKPVVGSQVHFHEAGGPYPAIVTARNDDGTIDLVTFGRNSVYFQHDVTEATWHMKSSSPENLSGTWGWSRGWTWPGPSLATMEQPVPDDHATHMRLAQATYGKHETSDADAARIQAARLAAREQHGFLGDAQSRAYVGHGIAQQLHAPGKTFTREEVLAVLRGARGMVGNGVGYPSRVVNDLITTFERME